MLVVGFKIGSERGKRLYVLYVRVHTSRSGIDSQDSKSHVHSYFRLSCYCLLRCVNACEYIDAFASWSKTRSDDAIM